MKENEKKGDFKIPEEALEKIKSQSELDDFFSDLYKQAIRPHLLLISLKSISPLFIRSLIETRAKQVTIEAVLLMRSPSLLLKYRASAFLGGQTWISLDET